MAFKLDQIRTFVAVAESGSLIDASKILGKTPSAVSVALKQFTQQLGNGLFETDRKSTLTNTGRFVLTQSRNALASFDEAMNSIQQYRYGYTGSVCVASVPSFSTRFLPVIVNNYKQVLPEVKLDLRDADSESISQLIRSGTIDLGIASKPGASHDLKTELLLEEPFGIVCRQDNALAQLSEPIGWDQLASQKTQFISNGLCKMMAHTKQQFLDEKSNLHIHNTTTLLSFVAEGFGVTLLPHSAVSGQYGLRFLRLKDKLAIYRLFMMQHPQNSLSPAAAAFKAQIKLLQKTAAIDGRFLDYDHNEQAPATQLN